MSTPQPFYDDDLAYIHDVGFSASIKESAPGLVKILTDAGIHDGRIVDLGCGGGVWARHLADLGFQVQGLDISPAMIEMARQRVPSAEFHVGSLWDFRLSRCRAVTALGEVVCYRSNGIDGHDLAALFRKVSDALEAGGLLIFDVPEIGLDRDSKSTCVEKDDWACLVRSEYEEHRDCVTRHITSFRKVGELYRRSQERHVVQLYQGSEVAKLLRQAGFRVRMVRKFGSFPLLPQRVGFIARKPRSLDR